MRIIPDDNLAYPILLTWDTGSTGSGFRLRNGEIGYFVTAKHVIYNEKNELRGNSLTLLCQTKDINDDSNFLFQIDLKKLESRKQVFFHPKYDVAAFVFGRHEIREDKSFSSLYDDVAIQIIRKGKSRMVNANAATTVSLINEVLISNDIYLYGYPTSLGLRKSPQFDYSKPLLRKGIVANVNKAYGTIILDCPVYYGNSGGPVVQIEQTHGVYQHKIIGVVSQFIPYSENWKNLANGLIHTEISNSGYSVAVAMDYVFEMLNIKM